jgi:hypothetical protein
MKELNEQDFSPEESLKLIHSMIETTRNLISDKSPYFLIWGWAVMIGCFLQYYLLICTSISSDCFCPQCGYKGFGCCIVPSRTAKAFVPTLGTKTIGRYAGADQ